MPDIDYLSVIEGNSRRFLDCLRQTDPNRAVPCCPGWRTRDLVWHLGQVQHFWGTVVAQHLQNPDAYEEPDRPETYTDTVAFCGASSERLICALGRAGPEEAVWTWSDDHTVGFVLRRQAHEALIHRVDAELTAGQEDWPTDRSVAVDGIDELLTVMVVGVPEWGTFEAADVLVHIEPIDEPLSWTLELGRFKGASPVTGNTYDLAAAELVRSSTRPDLSIQGEAWLLDKWLWGRTQGEEPTMTGNLALTAPLRELITEATQ